MFVCQNNHQSSTQAIIKKCAVRYQYFIQVAIQEHPNKQNKLNESVQLVEVVHYLSEIIIFIR